LFCYFLFTTREKNTSGQDKVTHNGGGKSIGVNIFTMGLIIHTSKVILFPPSFKQKSKKNEPTIKINHNIKTSDILL